MASLITIENNEWALVEDLFDPPGRPGAPARYNRREIVDAILFLARTGCQWRYLPDRYPPWEAVWQQWRRWRDSGVWEKAMAPPGLRGPSSSQAPGAALDGHD